ncbi:hypothetical protein BJ912DRAFT_1080218 [Pholiota molesta]|nr:hypothetical protein BJ912DRAFT_1080218 [Pholiota molesta]
MRCSIARDDGTGEVDTKGRPMKWESRQVRHLHCPMCPTNTVPPPIACLCGTAASWASPRRGGVLESSPVPSPLDRGPSKAHNAPVRTATSSQRAHGQLRDLRRQQGQAAGGLACGVKLVLKLACVSLELVAPALDSVVHSGASAALAPNGGEAGFERPLPSRLQVHRGHHTVYMHKGTAILQYLRHGDAEMPPGAARKTGLDQSHTGLDQSKPEPVLTGLWTVQGRSGPVHIGSVRFLGGWDKSKTGLGLGPSHLGRKTGPDRTSKHYSGHIEFGLGPIRISHLTALYKLGSSLDGSLTTADLWTRVFAVACQFSVEQNITQAIQSATGNTSNAVGGDLKRILDELTIRLDANFQLTSEQTITVRRICQEMIYQPRRVSFKNIHIEVDKVMRKNAVAYRLDNIFAVPARESKWVSDLKKITSSVRNAFRQDLRDSVIGPKQTSLEKFTAESAEKYRHGTMATASTQGYLVHNVLLRRFCIDHQTVFGIDASEDPDAPEDGSDDTEHPSKRKRVQKQKGRIPEGTDFWSKVDLWFKEGIEQ